MIKWFDDLRVGMRFKSPDMLVTREDIKRFAAEFDPQPYHLDEAAAERSQLKGLAASGWHTAAMAMRLAVETHPFGPHPLLGLGVDELRWLAPVRPGDIIHLEGEVVEVTPSRTRPQGTVRVKWTAFNQDGAAVLYVYANWRRPTPTTGQLICRASKQAGRCLAERAQTRCRCGRGLQSQALVRAARFLTARG